MGSTAYSSTPPGAALTRRSFLSYTMGLALIKPETIFLNQPAAGCRNITSDINTRGSHPKGIQYQDADPPIEIKLM